MTRRRVALTALMALLCLVATRDGGVAMAAAGAPGASGAPASPAPAAAPAARAWVQRSDAYSQRLVQAMARFVPEEASFLGVSGFDEQIVDLKPGFEDRADEAMRGAMAEYQKDLATEGDPKVRQDLAILINAGKMSIDEHEIEHRLFLPYIALDETVFQGLRALLDEQASPQRRQAALVRLRKYAGMEAGLQPVTELAMAATRERLGDARLLGPAKDQIERDLGNGATYRDGIGKLFQKYGLKGYEPAYAKLSAQLVAYDEFLRREILTRARTDFRLPAEAYALRLRQSGVDMQVDELVSRAEVSFREIQNEMATLAPLIAKEHGFASSDYRDVIRELKKNQIVGDAIKAHYEQRIAQIEEIIRREKIVTLPARPMRLRLASEAESAAVPAPNMHPPRLIGNTGEMGEFVLPLRIPGKNGETLQFDDFTHAAESWTLVAHEGRPGHELQFAHLIEDGTSIARAVFAFNSVNAEGWALYSEAEMKPYEPLDGQMFALQNRLMRAARAILDPGLQRGTISKEEAFRVLEQEVGISHALATEEVERYTFESPGQAPSYFCGYQHLMQMRTETERALGARFDRQRYHDFILGQGLVPPALLRQAVLEEFIPTEKARP